MWNFKDIFKSKPQSFHTQYLGIPNKAFDKKLKNDIQELEFYAEEVGKSLQNKYEKEFGEKTGKNLRVRVQRDIDGDAVEGLSSANAFETEYRSLIVIDYEDVELDEEFEDEISIPLWYYNRGGKHGTGTLYNLAQGNLDKEIEEVIKEAMNQF